MPTIGEIARLREQRRELGEAVAASPYIEGNSPEGVLLLFSRVVLHLADVIVAAEEMDDGSH